ncbi:hypothetical protein H0E87_023214 [Populus deltoides]|uniref:Protein kinase domain-containing protein n=1 Tax=Populus deltoides TaxID=3696 RepID=A0A8T2XF40_POPDE|nr:hypothetical protein H0E87_023214 [Populus deltoides]
MKEGGRMEWTKHLNISNFTIQRTLHVPLPGCARARARARALWDLRLRAEVAEELPTFVSNAVDQTSDSYGTERPLEGSKEYCLLSERNLHAKVSVKPKKHSPVISSSASSVDLRASDMERERQDGSSPRGVIEACLTGLESNSDFTRNSTAESEVPRSKAHSNWSRFFKSWKRFSLKHLTSPPPVPKEPKRKSRSTRENTVLRNLYNFKSTLQHFTFAELKMATNNFNHENLIGKGGFAEVYKGCLPDGRLVAIKQLTKGTLDEKTAGFLNELGIIAHVDHPNTAKLLGCGIDGGMHLVFELSPLGSLGSALHGLLNIIKLARTCENACILLDLGGGIGTVLCGHIEKFEIVNNGSGSIDVFDKESMNIFYEHDSVLLCGSLLNLTQKNSIVSVDFSPNTTTPSA